MVIQGHVAERVHQSAWAWGQAVNALIQLPLAPSSSSKNNALEVSYLSARKALEKADAAFFHPSILDMLYFPVSPSRSEPIVFRFVSISLATGSQLDL